MTQSYSLSKFELDVREVLQEAKSNPEIIEGVRPALKKLLGVEGLVPEAFQAHLENKYAQYLLYKPEDEAFSIVAFVWGPGQVAPVHDHLTWGLVGVLQGSIEESRYQLVQDDNGNKRIEKVKVAQANEGDITFVYPPNADIHSVVNHSDKQAITIHVYGLDISKKERNFYDVSTGEKKVILTKHDNAEAIYS